MLAGKNKSVHQTDWEVSLKGFWINKANSFAGSSNC
jgi:hypothetical protein